MRHIHPGEILREELIYANELSITETAQMLGISRQSLIKIIHEKSDITPEMSFVLRKYLVEPPKYGLICKRNSTFTLRPKRQKSSI